MLSTTAVSACISPSTSNAGSRSWRSATARCTLSAAGCRTEPKLENESSATRGSIPRRATNREAVGPPGPQHQEPVVHRVQHALARFAQRDPAALAARPQLLRERLAIRCLPRVGKLDLLERHAGVVRLAADHVEVAEQDGVRDSLVGEDAGGADHPG